MHISIDREGHCHNPVVVVGYGGVEVIGFVENLTYSQTETSSRAKALFKFYHSSFDDDLESQ
jgi:hypothetical protein